MSTSATEIAVAEPAPVTLSMICACGAGWPAGSVGASWQAELEEHVRARHPNATGYSLTLSCYPVEKERRKR